MSSQLTRLMMEAGMVGALYLLFALPALFTRRRIWILVVGLLGLLSTIAVFLPIDWPHLLPAIGKDWNWTGKLVSIAFTSIAATALVLFGAFRFKDFGLRFAQDIRPSRIILFAILPYLIFDGTIVWFMAPHQVPSVETLLYQATLPGIDEEFFFRGVMLAIFDRMFPAKLKLGGAPLGYGAIAVTIVFGAVHTVQFDKSLHLQLAILPGLFATITGFFLVWLRARTGSLALPIVTHNALNLINNILPAFV